MALLALTSSEQAGAATAAGVFNQADKGGTSTPVRAADYENLAAAERNLRAVAAKYHGRDDLSPAEEAELETAARPVVVALVLQAAREQGEAAFPIPGHSVQSFTFPAYCMDPHAAAPGSGEQFQLVPIDTLVPADLMPAYRGLLHSTAQRSGTHDNTTQSLVWQLRSAAKGDIRGQTLQLSTEQQQALSAADPNALNALQGYYAREQMEEALKSAIGRMLQGTKAGNAISQPSQLLPHSQVLQTLQQISTDILSRQTAAPLKQGNAAFTLLTPTMAAQTTSGGGYSSVHIDVANAADGPGVFLPNTCVAQSTRKVQRLAIQASPLTKLRQQALMTPAPWAHKTNLLVYTSFDNPVSFPLVLAASPAAAGARVLTGEELAAIVVTNPELIAAIAVILVGYGIGSIIANEIARNCVGGCSSPVLIPNRNQMDSPGNCTPQQHEDLQNAVRSSYCYDATACRPNPPRATTPTEAAENISKIQLCIKARQDINNICFMGGNDGHQKAIMAQEAALKKCQDVIRFAQ